MEGKEQKLESKSGFQKFQENVKVYVVHVEREFARKTIKKAQREFDALSNSYKLFS